MQPAAYAISPVTGFTATIALLNDVMPITRSSVRRDLATDTSAGAVVAAMADAAACAGAPTKAFALAGGLRMGRCAPGDVIPDDSGVFRSLRALGASRRLSAASVPMGIELLLVVAVLVHELGPSRRLNTFRT